MTSAKIYTDTDAANGKKIRLFANLYSPSGGASGLLLYCMPGGGAACGYFDLGSANGFDYSFASRMTAMGHHVIAMDHPGTGENTLPGTHPFLTPRMAADYLADSFAQIISRDELSKLTPVGVGHSMGGMVTTLIQARHRPFAAAALLGSSARGLDWGTTDEEKTYIDRPEALEANLESLVISRFGEPFPAASPGPSGKSITFGGANEAITAKLRDNMAHMYAAGGITSMIRGAFRSEVEALDIPLFFAFGDHDIGAPPDEVPQDYINAASIELHIMPETGHNSFAFPTIADLCATIDAWARKGAGKSTV